MRLNHQDLLLIVCCCWWSRNRRRRHRPPGGGGQLVHPAKRVVAILAAVSVARIDRIESIRLYVGCSNTYVHTRLLLIALLLVRTASSLIAGDDDDDGAVLIWTSWFVSSIGSSSGNNEWCCTDEDRPWLAPPAGLSVVAVKIVVDHDLRHKTTVWRYNYWLLELQWDTIHGTVQIIP